MMDKWEYMSIAHPADYGEIDNLNLMGSMGWEAYAVITYKVIETTFIKVFFKRKKK